MLCKYFIFITMSRDAYEISKERNITTKGNIPNKEYMEKLNPTIKNTQCIY